MNKPPELQFVPDWNKFIDELAEQAVDDWIEQKHAHEIVLNPPDVDGDDEPGDLRTVVR